MEVSNLKILFIDWSPLDSFLTKNLKIRNDLKYIFNYKSIEICLNADL